MSEEEHPDNSSDSNSPYEYASSDSSDEEELLDLPVGSPWTRAYDGSDVPARVAQLVSVDCCGRACLRNNQVGVGCFLFSLSQMGKDARKSSFLTALAISGYTDVGQRHRGNGERIRHPYMLPFCGHVCKQAFQRVYDVSGPTLTVARQQVQAGCAYPRLHGNINNGFAASLDRGDVVLWFRNVASTIGEPCPVRFRRQRKTDDVIIRYTTREIITFLPAYLMWRALYEQYTKYLHEKNESLQPPSYSAFFKLLKERCKDVCIRSPRSNVCDTCAVYQMHQARTATTLETENHALHVMDARAMRQQYAKDAGHVGSKYLVSTIDYAQNIALPHVAATPSSWYFLSLLNVSLFGVFLENSKRQANFFYSERKAGKGSNEVASMLHVFALDNDIYQREVHPANGTVVWTVYADNCGGQNKNNHLIRYFLFLVDSGRLRAASLYFLVKGHTKNNCDRGFGLIKRAYSKSDVYTLDQVGDAITNSGHTNTGINLERTDDVFLDWKTSLEPVYRDLKNIQHYQLFNMSASTPGVVLCRKRPTSAPVEQKLSKGEPVDFEALWKTLKPAKQKDANPEKIADLHKKILPFIPDEYKTDALYRAPTEEEKTSAQETKRRRRKTTLTLMQRKALANDTT